MVCIYSGENRQYFLFSLRGMRECSGQRGRKGYRVLYAVAVRFIVRSRFVRSFVYCTYIQYLHDDALGVLCTAHPSTSRSPLKFSCTRYSHAFSLRGERKGTGGRVSHCAGPQLYPLRNPSRLLHRLWSSLRLYIHAYTKGGHVISKGPPLLFAFGVRSIKQDVVVLLFSTPCYILSLVLRSHHNLPVCQPLRQDRIVRYWFLDLFWIFRHCQYRLCLIPYILLYKYIYFSVQKSFADQAGSM